MGIFLCVAGMVLVGSSVSVSQLLVDYPALSGQAVRYGLAALALAAIARLYPRDLVVMAPAKAANQNGGGATTTRSRGVRPTVRELGILTVLAATGLAAFNACILVALRHADAAVVGTIVGAAPLGLALLGPALRGARPSTRIVAAATVVVAGTALVQGTGRADTIGMLATLGALAGEIAFTVLAAIVLPRLGAVRVAAWSCALAVPLLIAGALVAGEPARWRMPTPAETGALAYLTVLMTVVAFLAWFTGLQRLGVERAGMIVGVMPVATLASAAVMAGALPAAGQTLGVLTVAAGLALGLTTRRPTPVDLAVSVPANAANSGERRAETARSTGQGAVGSPSAARTASA